MKNLFLESSYNYNKFKKLKSFSKFELVVGDETVLPSKDHELILSSTRKVWYSLAFVFVAVGVAVFFLAKAFSLQVIGGETNYALSTQNRIRKFSILPERGVIYDRNGNILVRNKPAFSIEMNTEICSLGGRFPNLCKDVVHKLSEYLEVDYDKTSKDIDVGKSSIILSTGLEKDHILKLEANLGQLPSISIVTSPQRDYLFKNAYAHLIGYVGSGDTLFPTIVGKSGIEESYNTSLSGLPGSRVVQVDSTGSVVKQLSEEKAIPGKDVTLYLDLALQKKAYELLEKTVEEKKAAGGAIVAQNPQDGSILALVSYPSFDPDKLSTGISVSELTRLNTDMRFPFFNRALSGTYPPGSTFKLVTGAAALSEGYVTENTTIFDPGYISVSGYTFRNWKLSGHGDVNFRKALQVSNDTYFYTVGGGYGDVKGLGIANLYKWARKFGYGTLTNIDIEGEVKGYMPDGLSRAWYLGDTYITSIGQGDVLSTPLQVNNATTYFANGGVLYRPRIVKSIFGEKETASEVISKDLVSQKIYDLVRDGMYMVTISGGTAYPFFDFPEKHGGMLVAGKTGTSEYNDSKGEAKTHALFTVFGPYDPKGEEKATIALTVFVEGGGGGADDAAPIARQLLDLWFK